MRLVSRAWITAHRSESLQKHQKPYTHPNRNREHHTVESNENGKARSNPILPKNSQHCHGK